MPVEKTVTILLILANKNREMHNFLYFIISFLASVVGAVCGVGGGVVIRPILDMFRLDNASTISFLSGCAVLSMSCYSVGRSILSGEKNVDFQTGTPLSVGAAVGGLLGKQIFSQIQACSPESDMVGAIQAICMLIITVGTLVYTLRKNRITPWSVTQKYSCMSIGMLLGMVSSFLGIGGGPINLVILHYFFGMNTKTAAANSLYVIVFSQITNIIYLIVTHQVPEVSAYTLSVMILGGISGGILGRWLNKYLPSRMVEYLYICLLVIIILISIWNFWSYSFC